MNSKTTRPWSSIPLLAACALMLAVGSPSAQPGGGAPSQEGAAGPGASPAGAGPGGAAGPGRVGGPGRFGGPRAGGAGRAGGPGFGGRGGFGGPAQPEPAQRGLLVNEAGAQPGYTLFAPLNATTTYLIDLEGNVVRSWESELVPSAWVYFTDDGHVLRGGREPEPLGGFSGGGQGGRFQKFTFDGEIVWDYTLNTEQRLPHHDVEILPNGNLLAIIWDAKSRAATEAAGRRAGFIPANGIWSDILVELEPDGANGARVVWEWHIWDHLIQNVDPALPNYGNPAEQPGRIDINGDSVGQANAPGNPTQDVFHVNSVAYNANLDQIIISVPNFNEVWVIDHSTTTAEAAGTTGGRFGRGGELLYRWGNPQVYGRGTAADRKLGFQHDAHWIPEGFPGAGNLMIFSNRSPADAGGAGGGRGGGFGGFGGGFGGRTEVLELTPPVDERGRYRLDDGAAFGPAEPVWKYSADDFNATFISGASRLTNGNTLITAGPQGRLFEVDSTGKIVWEYWSPYGPNTDVLGASAQSPYAVFRAIRIPPDHPGLAGLAP